MTDYYSILGINKGSSDDEIKKAYRKQAMKYHPDRNEGDTKAESKFKDISEIVFKDTKTDLELLYKYNKRFEEFIRKFKIDRYNKHVADGTWDVNYNQPRKAMYL